MAYSPTRKITSVITKDQLIQSFKELGVEEGMTLEVHSSLSAFDYVVGGAQTIVDALLDTVGYEGTIAMAMQDSSNSDPAGWQNPPIVHELHQVIRENTPAFNRKESNASEMGAVVENLRRREGVSASFSPSCAYVAWGKYARLICGRQPLHFPLGEGSPTSHLYDLDGYALLLGVSYSNCTALHLAEYRSDRRGIIVNAGAVEMENQRVWKKYLDMDLDASVFEEIGMQMERFLDVRRMKINGASCILFNIREAVDFFTEYMRNSL